MVGQNSHGEIFYSLLEGNTKAPPLPTPTSNPEYTPGKKLTDKQKRQIKRVSNIFTELKTLEWDILNPDRLNNLKIKNKWRTSNI